MGKLLNGDQILIPYHVRHELASLASGLFSAIHALRIRPEDAKTAFFLLDATAERLSGMLRELDDFETNRQILADRDSASLERDRPRESSLRVRPEGSIEAEPLSEFVLIDDDPLTLLSWRVSAKDFGHKAHLFSSPTDFFRLSDSIPATAKIYIDEQLGDQLKGTVIAREIYEKGFTDIFIVTGEASRDFDLAPHPWISGVIGKQPPWTLTTKEKYN